MGCHGAFWEKGRNREKSWGCLGEESDLYYYYFDKKWANFPQRARFFIFDEYFVDFYDLHYPNPPPL